MAATRKKTTATSHPGRIRVGIGGWTYAPWRETFYPQGLTQKRELEYASRQVTAIEINGTFYGAQKPSTFAAWRAQAPDDTAFVFSLKAPRYATQRRLLAESGPVVERFIDGGIAELGDKLGPLLWQLPPRHAFDADDLARFFDLLPPTLNGKPLRHVLEARHGSFLVPEFLALCRERGIATVFTDSADYPSYANLTADFAYARLMRSRASIVSGYPAKELAQWAERAHDWSRGAAPQDLPYVEGADPGARAQGRDVFVFMIDGAKERAPAAAMGLLERLSQE